MEYGLVFYYEDKEGPQAIALSYDGECKRVDAEVAAFFFDSADQEEELPEELLGNLANGNFEGRTSSVAELRETNLAYSIEDASVPFQTEVLWVKGEMLEMPLELRGYKEVQRAGTVEETEPLTFGEAIWLLEKLGGETNLKGIAEHRMVSYLEERLRQICDMVEEYLEAVDQLNWSRRQYINRGKGVWTRNNQRLMPRWKGFYNLLPEEMEDREKERRLADLMKRVIHTVHNSFIGAPWSYASRYKTSDREGITDITEELSVQGRTPQAQYTDCDLPDRLRQEQQASDSERDFFLTQKRIKQGEAFHDLFNLEGKNKGFAERARYYWRKEQERIERFRDLLNAIHVMPEHLLIKYFGRDGENLKERYKESVRQCSPGPARSFLEGAWKSLPLVGKAAIKALVARGFDPSKLSPNVRFHKGATWHKLYLRADMLKELEKALEIRLRPYSRRLDEHMAAEGQQGLRSKPEVEGTDYELGQNTR